MSLFKAMFDRPRDWVGITTVLVLVGLVLVIVPLAR